MEIEIGEKIRELRRRNGRKQEDLAKALGVTFQAVSRWEANGGCPDMALLPAIANYFHVTIDELFGYRNDRWDRLRDVQMRADELLDRGGDFEGCVLMLRSALLEFPEEPQLLVRLGIALSQLGLNDCDRTLLTDETGDPAQDCSSRNRENVYWQEALAIFEKVSEMQVDWIQRMIVLLIAVQLYSEMGEYNKAKVLAEKQNLIRTSREVLLMLAADETERERYQGEALLALVRELKEVMEIAVQGQSRSDNSAWKLDKLLAVVRIYESVLDDGNCGMDHYPLSVLYLRCALCAAQMEDIPQAVAYFDTAFEHKKQFEVLKGSGEYRYTAPLVSQVTTQSDVWNESTPGSWDRVLDSAPEELLEVIRHHEKYAECFV